MKQIDLTITALSPLAIGRQKPGGSVSEAEAFIPGIVLRGALAEKLLQEAGGGADLRSGGGDFQQLFLGEQPAIFRNAYPATVGGGNVHVLPATSVSSKTDPGFKKAGPPLRCGVFDTLIDRFLAERVGHPYDPSSPIDSSDRIEPYSGYYSSSKGLYNLNESPKRLLTRVGINRRRSTSEERILYSLEVLGEATSEETPTCFRGSILVSDDALANKLVNFLNTTELRLGGSTSRGLGRVTIKAVEVKVRQGAEQRIYSFNKVLAERWKFWRILNPAVLDPLTGQTFFSLDLQSSAIFTDRWRRTIVVSEEMLQTLTGVEDGSLTLHVSYAASSLRSGWNAAWGLMKVIELVTGAGAVYLFSTKNPKLWRDPLQQIEHFGIGERTNEGFGQVRICDTFHQIFREQSL